MEPVKLTDAVNQKFRDSIYRRTKATFDFHQGMVNPEVVLEVMQQELDRLKEATLNPAPKSPTTPAMRSAWPKSIEIDDVEDEEDEEPEDGF